MSTRVILHHNVGFKSSCSKTVRHVTRETPVTLVRSVVLGAELIKSIRLDAIWYVYEAPQCPLRVPPPRSPSVKRMDRSIQVHFNRCRQLPELRLKRVHTVNLDDEFSSQLFLLLYCDLGALLEVIFLSI